MAFCSAAVYMHVAFTCKQVMLQHASMATHGFHRPFIAVPGNACHEPCHSNSVLKIVIRIALLQHLHAAQLLLKFCGSIFSCSGHSALKSESCHMVLNLSCCLKHAFVNFAQRACRFEGKGDRAGGCKPTGYLGTCPVPPGTLPFTMTYPRESLVIDAVAALPCSK
jgi:hypothetical protein